MIDEAWRTIKTYQLSDQFSDTTRTVRRNLLVAASVALLLSLEEVKIASFLGLDLSAPTAAAMAVGAVAVIVAYEFVSFVVYGVIDHRRWAITPTHIALNDAEQQMYSLTAAYETMHPMLDKVCKQLMDGPAMPSSATLETWPTLEKFVVQCGVATRDYKTAWSKNQAQLLATNIVQLARIYILDWGVPLALGVFCLIRTAGSIGQLIEALL